MIIRAADTAPAKAQKNRARAAGGEGCGQVSWQEAHNQGSRFVRVAEGAEDATRQVALGADPW